MVFIPIFPRPRTTDITIFILFRRKLRLGTVMLFAWVLTTESTKLTLEFTSLCSQGCCSSYSVPTYLACAEGQAGASAIVASTEQGLEHSEYISQSWGAGLWPEFLGNKSVPFLIGLHSCEQTMLRSSGEHLCSQNKCKWLFIAKNTKTHFLIYCLT